jgi:hypothetical protein
MKVIVLFLGWCGLVMLCWASVIVVAVLISVIAAFVGRIPGRPRQDSIGCA